MQNDLRNRMASSKLKKNIVFISKTCLFSKVPSFLHVLTTLGRKSAYMIKFGRARKRKKVNFRFFLTVTTT